MVVSAIVSSFKVKRIFVDSGKAVEVSSWNAYRKIRLKEQALSKASPFYGFANHPNEVKGSITLSFILGDDKHTTTEYVQFHVIDHLMAYNAIFGRPTMRMKNMVIATFCMKIKFLKKTGVGFL
ncbi:hypothetical protein PVK06_020309 [Gossypium arboreum]|uniref:Uncharacterized protein n=1 Tax=Gossypium arboreum TaxID=29729 RepID=A0ABR0PM11_GOSAR|nr:hypothetical protein PVK06_020309 [Gossypium arboreum]